MKHAGSAALEVLAPLLQRLRTHGELVERTPGAFYLKSKAYLHFHDDPSGIFADVKLDRVDFTRLRVTTTREQARFLALVARSLKTPRRAV